MHKYLICKSVKMNGYTVRCDNSAKFMFTTYQNKVNSSKLCPCREANSPPTPHPFPTRLHFERAPSQKANRKSQDVPLCKTVEKHEGNKKEIGKLFPFVKNFNLMEKHYGSFIHLFSLSKSQHGTNSFLNELLHMK